MAIYDRTGTSSNSTAAVMPSQDLGSVIVQSLQTAVESMKEGDTGEISLKESIQQGVDDSSLMKDLKKSSDKISEIISNQSKDNTKAVAKEKIADKRDDEMLKLLKTQNDREKKEAKDNVQAQRARAQKNAKDRHKDIMGKGGFGSVQAIGSTILKTILKGLVIVLLVMEIIAAVKYAWKWLWGVKIPELITRIRLWFTGIVARIKANIENFFINIKNFFTGLWRPVARFFGDKDFGMSKEDKEKAKKIQEDPAYKAFIEKNNDALSKYDEVKDSVDGIFKTLEQENLVTNVDAFVDRDKLQDAIEKRDYVEARNIVKPLMDVMYNEMEAIKKEGKEYSSEDGFLTRRGQQLEARFSQLTELYGAYGDEVYARTGQVSTLHAAANKINAAKSQPGYALWLELESLRKKALEGDELINVENAVKTAQAEEYMEMLGTRQVTTATDKTLGEDEYYGQIVNKVHSTMEEKGIPILYQENESLKWIQTTGDKWINTFKETMNDLLQNVGVKADIRLEYSNHGQAAWAPSSGGAPGTRS